MPTPGTVLEVEKKGGGGGDTVFRPLRISLSFCAV